MATYEEVINGNINSLKELKDLVKSFKDELATAKEGTQEWKDACEGLSIAQARVDKISKAAKGTLEGYDNSAKDSINSLKARIKELNNERNAMDMNSQEYADATATLNELNTRLRESGVAAGDMKANVGNYAQSLAAGFNGVKDAVGQASSQMISAIGGLGESLGGLSPVVGTVTTGMKGLSAATGPVGIALAALAAVLAVFKQGIQSSEENTNKFKEALAPIQAVLTVLQRVIQNVTSKVLDWMIALRNNEAVIKTVKIATTVITTAFKTLQDVVTSLVTAFEKLWGKLKEFGSKAAKVFEPVTKAVGKVYDKVKPLINKLAEKTGIKENWDEATKAVNKFGKEVEDTEKKVKENLNTEINLQKSRRSLIIANAKLEGELAKKQLEINEARNEEAKDYDKILGLINEKTEIEKKLAQNNVAIKAQELAVIRQRNAMSDSTAKDLDAEAQAAADLIKAQAALTQVEASAEKEKERILRAQRTEARTRATNELTASLKNLESQFTETVSALDKPIAPEGSEADIESVNAYHEQVIANYQAEYEAYSAMTEQKIALLEEFIEKQKAAGNDTSVQEAEITKLRANQSKEYKKMIESQNADDKQRTKQLKAIYNSQLSAYSNLMGAMSALFEENTVAYKLTSTAKALIDTYLAANAVLAEQQGGYIARAVAMAATIATGLANVMAIWKTDTKNPSVSTGTQATATAAPQVDNTPYTYARTVQTVAGEETINNANNELKVYVLESDITSAQNKAKVRVAESEW